QLHTGEFRYVYIYESILQFGSFSLYVIEGIGDFLSPFPNLFYWDPFHQPQMTCLEVNNIYLFGFSPDPSENCGFDILSVNEVPDESKILIYPNPANKILNVESSFFNKKNTNIRIVNSIGIEVFSDLCQKLNKDIFTIEVSDYPNGIYFIIIKSANADIIAKKLIINH
ncbi:MAG: T9SS type A sorting domain-containing protein, partial [Bacteroidales bacterium]|nr:T9SS type A sorting domain-containing protein [Bacteroidales bacterium]